METTFYCEEKSMRRFGLYKLVGAVMVGAMITASAPVMNVSDSNVYADELSDAEEEKEATSAKKEEAKKKLDRLKAEKEDVMKMIEDLDKEITGYEDKIRELSAKKNVIQAQISVTENSLQSAYIAESSQYESMKERIQFAYENGDAAYIEALISVKDYSGILNQSEYVEQVSVYDQKQLEELASIEKEIYEFETSLQESLGEVEDIKTEAEGEAAALQVMQDGKKETLKDYNISIADTEYTIEELDRIEAAQDATIAALEAAARQQRAAAEQAALQAQQQAQQIQPAAAETASPGDASQQQEQPAPAPAPAPLPSYSGGAFKWPVPSSGYITSYYGPRTSPTPGASSFHRGIDIGCSNGATIVAAADGVVYFAGYLEGGGNCVMIDHGNGISTCYFHLSGFNTASGASVQAGAPIAFAGSTGISTGPHLHFAVRVNGGYVDPMGYL